MKLLLDTHILLWTLLDSPELPVRARELIAFPQNEIYYSIVVPWEIEIKNIKHPGALALSSDILIAGAEISGFKRLSIVPKHIQYLRKLKTVKDHQDPFDRIQLCQAAVEGMIFISADSKLVQYAEACLLKV
ncbi:MAG: type II toxin-antitoxin system VapC family toxin [Anaerolineaceae bacterium]|nr:type II toxin-antitoxin system VapC family toxin [Anaerolineaceae bacterium]